MSEKINPNKQYPLFRGLLCYFPRALRYISHVSLQSNKQHHADKPLHWDKSKSTDEPDALLRHLTEIAKGNEFDDDGLLHRGKVAWRANAFLERYLEAIERDADDFAGEYLCEPSAGQEENEK